MTNEERDIIAAFVARVGGAPAAPQSPWGGASVPATQTPQQQAQPPLPPVDPEADKFIAEQFDAHPEARYRITQLAFVQEHALIEAQNRMKQMQWQMQQMQEAMQQQAQQGGGSGHGGGFFSNLFGGGRSSSQSPPPGAGPWGQPGQAPPQYQQPHYPPPPPPQYPAGYQPSMFQRRGSGFLGSALTTAAGVAGGIFAADAIRDMFSPHRGFMGGGFGGMPTESGAGPWADPSAGQGYVDQGQWDQPVNDPGAWNDPGQAAPDAGGWDQGGGDAGGGWDQGGGDMGGGDWGGGDQGGGDDSLF